MNTIEDLLPEAQVLASLMFGHSLKALLIVWAGVAAVLVWRRMLGLRFTTTPVHFGVWLSGVTLLVIACVWAMSSFVAYAYSPRSEGIDSISTVFWLLLLPAGLPALFGAMIWAHTLGALKSSDERARRREREQSEGVAL